MSFLLLEYAVAVNIVLTLGTDDSDAQDTQSNVPSTDKSDTINKQLIDLWSSQGQDLATMQHETKDLQLILNWLENGLLQTPDNEARRILLTAEHFQFVDGILYYRAAWNATRS